MTIWTRWNFLGQHLLPAFMLGIALLPTLVILFQVALDTSVWALLYADASRWLMLVVLTLLLTSAIAGTAILMATMLALITWRFSTVRQRNFLLWLILPIFFLPLVSQAAGWQVLLGPAGPTLWYRYFAVVLIHASHVLPITMVVLGAALVKIPPELEESARLDASILTVLWRVTIPGIRQAWELAFLLAALPVLTDMTVTDLWSVRSFAEETYIRIQTDAGHGDRAAALLALPFTIMAAWRLGSFVTSAEVVTVFRREYQHKPKGWLKLLSPLAFVLALIPWIPLAGLFWQCGQTGDGAFANWSFVTASTYFLQALTLDGPLLLHDSIRAAVVALFAMAAGWILAWYYYVCNGPMRHWLPFVISWFFFLPAPILGLGLIEIGNSCSSTWMVYLLQDTPLLLIWGQTLRALPFSFVLCAMGLSTVERSLVHMLALEGASNTWLAWCWLPRRLASLLVANSILAFTLALGDLPLAALVAPPGTETFASRTFQLLHTGTANQQAALALFHAGTVLLFLFISWMLTSVIMRHHPLYTLGNRLRAYWCKIIS